MERLSDGYPFQARVRASGAGAEWDAVESPPHSDDDDLWSLDALEQAYQRALETADIVAQEAEVATASLDENSRPPVATNLDGSRTACSSAGGAASQSERAAANAGLSPGQVLEALLFVGGEPLTVRRLADLLGGEHLHDQVEEMIASLEARYADQGRPYRVQLGEGGYRLSLRSDYESVRNRVYGLGPKDVRLSQDALEVLALVAYQQPISRLAIEATGKPNAASVLRQLLRLELIALERGDGGKDDITYRTTPRFLELFALDRLEDLPHPEDLMFK